MLYQNALVFILKQKIQLFIALSCAFSLMACVSNVHLYHTSADSLIEQGRQAEARGNIGDATRAYEEAAKLSGRGNMYLGNLAYARQDFATAEQQYRLALRDIPDNAALYNNLAWSLLKQKHKLAEAETFAILAVQRSDQKTADITWETLNSIRRVRRALGHDIASTPAANPSQRKRKPSHTQNTVQQALEDLKTDFVSPP